MTPREQLQAAYELAFYPPRLHAVWKRIKDRRGQPDPALLALVEQALQLQAALPETGYASQRALRRLAVYQANARAFGTVGCLRRMRRILGAGDAPETPCVPAGLVRDIGLPEFSRQGWRNAAG